MALLAPPLDRRVPTLQHRKLVESGNVLCLERTGMAVGVPRATVDASPADHIDPLVIRTGTLESSLPTLRKRLSSCVRAYLDSGLMARLFEENPI